MTHCRVKVPLITTSHLQRRRRVKLLGCCLWHPCDVAPMHVNVAPMIAGIEKLVSAFRAAHPGYALVEDAAVENGWLNRGGGSVSGKG